MTPVADLPRGHDIDLRHVPSARLRRRERRSRAWHASVQARADRRAAIRELTQPEARKRCATVSVIDPVQWARQKVSELGA